VSVLRLFTRGIREKLMTWVSLLVGGIALFVAFFFPWRLQQQALRATTAKAASMRDITAYSVTAALYFRDTLAMREVLVAIMKDPEIVSVGVEDGFGRTIVRAGTEPAESGPTDEVNASLLAGGRLLVTGAPVYHDGTRIGRVELAVSLDSLGAQVAAARRTGILFGLFILAFGLAVAYAIAQVLTSPLRRVGDTVRAIAAGDLSLRAAAPSDRDVAELVHAFNGMVDALVGVQADLARANVDLEHRVHERTATLRTFIDVTPQAIVSTDLQGIVTLWNRAAERLFGWRADEVIGHQLPNIPEAGRDAFMASLRALEDGTIMQGMEFVRQRKDGSHVHVLNSASALRDEEQRPIGYVAVITDLTERQALEGQLRQAQKMEAVGRLAGGVAHDFNNILTVITATTSLLLDDQLPAYIRSDIEEISTAAMRAAALTRQLLAFTRSQVVHLAPVCAGDVVTALSPMLRRLLPAHARIELDTGDSGRIMADVSQIEQIVMNLALNASDAMPNGGTMIIRTRDVTLDAQYVRDHLGVIPGEYVMLAITDDGMGMAPEVLTRIFEPFFTTKPIGKGTGLGLATTYAIVQRLGGRIDVETRAGAGTTLRIYIPRAGAEQLLRPAQLPADAESRGSQTVLLVEDYDAVRLTLKRSLERLGYLVLDAPSGEDGLTVVQDAGIRLDVIVSDMMMPGMNGRDFADAVKLVRPDVPVVFMSGYADAAVRDRTLVDTQHAFVHKPVSGASLARAIQDLLGRASSSR
jgi:PAS domain S-box-containing protein